MSRVRAGFPSTFFCSKCMMLMFPIMETVFDYDLWED